MTLKEEVQEILADNEHRTWANWQDWVHGLCEVVKNKDGTIKGFLIPYENVKRWDKQIATVYHELSEEDKEKDRREVKEATNAILSAIESRIPKERDNEWMSKATGSLKTDVALHLLSGYNQALQEVKAMLGQFK